MIGAVENFSELASVREVVVDIAYFAGGVIAYVIMAAVVLVPLPVLFFAVRWGVRRSSVPEAPLLLEGWLRHQGLSEIGSVRFEGVVGDESNDDIGLVLWSLKKHPDGASTEVIASALPQQLRTKAREALERAEDRGLLREVVPDWWEITEAGRVFSSGQS